MKCTDLRSNFQTLLERIPYVTIATVCPDRTPWATPIVGHFDDDLNLYFISARASQHGQNMAHDPRIFVTIFDSRVPQGQGEGLYMQMRVAILITTPAIQQAKRVAGISLTENLPHHREFLGACPLRCYKATLEHLWYNG